MPRVDGKDPDRPQRPSGDNRLTSQVHLRPQRPRVESQPAEFTLQRAAWQPILFAKKPRRSQLLQLSGTWPCRPIRINVHRNQPFEFVGTVLGPYLYYASFP